MASCEDASRSHKAVVDESHLALFSRRQCSLYTFTNGYDPIEHQLPHPYDGLPGALGATMKRREFISLIAGATTWPLVARAQRAGQP
jgi:hypothetical protein